MSGALVLVATPIGNLGDISPRAIDALRNADVIACEDTRHTRKLLTHFDISGVTLIALHEHNEFEIAGKVVQRIANGETVALVSDAGMPIISDPGERLVASVALAELPVTVIPGANAAIAALAVSGLPADRFVFEGFLTRKSTERRNYLAELATEKRTLIFYESPHRIAATVTELASAFGGDRRAAVVRELTKIHEEVRRATLGELKDHLGSVKGECVLVVEGAPEVRSEMSDDEIRERVRELIAQGASTRDAAATIAAELNVSKKRVYDLAVQR